MSEVGYGTPWGFCEALAEPDEDECCRQIKIEGSFDGGLDGIYTVEESEGRPQYVMKTVGEFGNEYSLLLWFDDYVWLVTDSSRGETYANSNLDTPCPFFDTAMTDRSNENMLSLPNPDFVADCRGNNKLK